MQKVREDSAERQGANLIKKLNKDSRYSEEEHKQLVRQNTDRRNAENQSKQQKKLGSVDQLIKKFHVIVQEGALNICTCCTQMFYRETVRITPKSVNIDNRLKEKLITGVRSADDKEWICHTCYNALRNKKIPCCAVANLLDFPAKPPELDLSDMEQRLVAPRIPFMSLHQLPRSRQLSLNGNVVNVPANVNKTVLKLPRNLDENQCIPIKLKRKLSYKQHVDVRNICPTKVINAVNWLVKNRSLYQEEG